jgi:hypothetical protein
LIDRAPVKPFDPIACRTAVARSEGQGRPKASRCDHAVNAMSDTGSAFGRRSLALDGSEHGGRLTARRDGGPHVDVFIVAVLSANIALALATCAAHAEPVQNPRLRLPAIATASSDPWSDHVSEAAKRFAIPERWIRAVIQAESAGDVHAVSPKSAMGLMQIMPATWAELRARYGLGDDPFKPRDNILAGTAYLREMLDRFGKKGFLAAYNAGPTRYEEYRAKGRPLPRETIDYLKKLAPIIDGTVPVPSKPLRPSDRRSAARSAIFAQVGSGWSIEPVHGDLNSNAAADTVFSASGAPGEASTNSDFVSDLTAIAPPPNHGWDDADKTIRPSGGDLFVRRSSGSTP